SRPTDSLAEWKIIGFLDDNPFQADKPAITPQVHRVTPAAAALDVVPRTAGAWPSARDAVDARVMDEVRKGGGKIINCVSADGSSRCKKNGGGWPKYEVVTRPLTLPADPHGDGDGDGYTNLEEWLHAYSAVAEGRAESNDL